MTSFKRARLQRLPVSVRQEEGALARFITAGLGGSCEPSAQKSVSHNSLRAHTTNKKLRVFSKLKNIKVKSDSTVCCIKSLFFVSMFDISFYFTLKYAITKAKRELSCSNRVNRL